MDFNTILYRLGIDPSDFVNENDETIKSQDGWVYEVRQRTDIRKCPKCNSTKCNIKDYDYVEINCSETDHIKDTLRIKKVRFKCKDCGTTFTPPISGIERNSRISNQTLDMITKDFTKMITFKDIGIRYGISTNRVIQIFDEKFKFVPRKSMPFVLCIDEIKFDKNNEQKYNCILYDFDHRCIVDIIKNRQLPYLDEYFTSIKESERDGVKYFISDMYDGYRTIRSRYFKKAVHIIDLFHIVVQLTRVVNKMRVKTMNSFDINTIEYKFMKSHWKLFLCRKEDIPNKYYNSKKTGEVYLLEDLVFRCVIRNADLLEGYNCLQDLFHYNTHFYSFNEALVFIDSISDRLMLIGNEDLEDVAYTYRKWRCEIASGLSKSQSPRHYTNGIAESLNNQLKTIKKTAYGYHNFDRFRKRAMIIKTYKKDLS